jgi:hypothetical protein
MEFIKGLKKIDKKRLIIAVILIAFGVFGRIFRIHFLPDLYNVEPITLAALLSGAFLGGGYVLVVPLAIIALTDLYIGNSPILYFTWSAWGVIGLLSLILRKSNKEKISFGLKITGMGVASSLFFFFWTNFGVWAIGEWYPHTWQGLTECYIMGLPFLKMNLLGNLVIVPGVAFPLIFILKYKKAFAFHVTRIQNTDGNGKVKA